MRKVSISLVLLAAGSPAMAEINGNLAFTQSCGACHYDPAKSDIRQRVGPPLKGVVGRRAAAAPGFSRYSQAMTRSGKTWNNATLDTFLTAPAKLIPGTTMAFAGVSDANKRAAIIAYLNTGK